MLISIKNKKGDISSGQAIMWVLGLIVLAITIYFLFFSKTSFGDFISGLLPGQGSNVDSVRSGCQITCDQKNEVDFCQNKRLLKLANNVKIQGSCQNFVEHVPTSGIVACTQFTCATDKVYTQTCSDLGGKWQTTCDATTQEDRKTLAIADSGVNSNKQCCVKINIFA